MNTLPELVGTYDPSDIVTCPDAPWVLSVSCPYCLARRNQPCNRLDAGQVHRVRYNRALARKVYTA